MSSMVIKQKFFGKTLPISIVPELIYVLLHHFLDQVCEGQPTKATRMIQAEEAVSRIKVKLIS